ncbi:MAG: hypothetical protein CME32_27905 [Gimesia sp.]|nr:hypothetical protein [Gimesia chilikensis]MBN73098.1 hypothetical protein [Gimesia sp.]
MDRELNPEEFVDFISDLIVDMKAGLPEVASEFYEASGRGAIALQFQDAVTPQDRRMGIDYVTPARLPDHKYLKQLIQEYDPTSELVVFATTKNGQVQFVSHLTFAELQSAPE